MCPNELIMYFNPNTPITELAEDMRLTVKTQGFAEANNLSAPDEWVFKFIFHPENKVVLGDVA